MESTDSSAGSQQPNLPPGFRFHPTDEELVVHYLKKKTTSSPLPVAIIAEVDLYKFDPWELPAKATFGEQEWYFFSPRDRKYPNGARPNRAATSGYWKATGTDKPVLASGGTQKVGVKKALVFYGGKPPKGIKTNWIMHEYRLADNKVTNKPPGFDIGNKKNSLRLDDWVLCRIYKKNNMTRIMDHEKEDSMDSMLPNIILQPSMAAISNHQQSSRLLHHGAFLENNNDQNTLFVEGLINANEGMINNNNPNSSILVQNATNSNAYLMKRALPSLFWNDGDEVGESSKRALHEDGHDNQNTNSSIVTMLSQLPQTPSFGDATFRQPYQLSGLNWFP